MKEEEKRQIQKDGIVRRVESLLLNLMMERGAMSKGMQAALRSWKKHGNRFYSRASTRNAG